jgi:hypothetical protein
LPFKRNLQRYTAEPGNMLIYNQFTEQFSVNGGALQVESS